MSHLNELLQVTIRCLAASNDHCCNFETIPMVTVLYAGIQDTLNLIMV